jgi:dienelactone hydrolase
MKSIAIAVIAVLTSAVVASAQVQKSDVDIKAADGVALKATYFSPGRPGPAMLLLHQCNMDRHAWDGLATDLAGAGVHVLTLDFRGFGESGGDRFDFAQARTVMAETWPGDVDAAYAYLLGQSGVDRARVAAGGASCGVTQSSDLATRHAEIKTLMLLSGTTSESAQSHVMKMSDVAVFGAAAEEDARAAEGIKTVVGASKNAASTLKMYGGTEHGVPLFEKHAELQPMVVSWVATRLGLKD